MNSKPVSESQVETIELVLPNDTNPLGNILGGRVMHLIDITASIAAMRHARQRVVTAQTDELSFHHPIKLGHFIILRASVNYAGKTSMEVGVKVLSEDPVSGEQKHTSSAYLTFVAVDEEGNPTQVPPLELETDEDKRRNREAKQRREARLEDRKNI
ncbi:MAG: acyl-CoA thioesterase [Candidatus Marinimicrobia bacterium]|nr:acyl-CoA thioesterase [Candidatus Neomarinimicrobiota bacterium]MCF7829006.1 acyl-CoA thioesterase [Candidatus Neomarinimicrobiota bacterium]MCF7879966.1 acyl-CoA thioesterase [Candidatus Neomarinimicrobiota bacterium]